jgi:hypothetical protein
VPAPPERSTEKENVMSCKAFLFCLLSAAPFLCRSASGAYIGPLDFTLDSTGSPPGSANDYTTHADVKALVVDENSSPADPFSEAGGHALLLEDASDSVSAYINWTGALPGLTRGVFSTDFDLEPLGGSDSPQLKIRLGKVGTHAIPSNRLALELRLRDGNIYIDDANLEFDNLWTENTAHTLTIHFDTVAGTFQADVDGTPLADGAQTTFALSDSFTDPISAFGFYAGTTANTNSRAFLDNMSLAVPEPAALSLLGMGGLMLLRRRCGRG